MFSLQKKITNYGWDHIYAADVNLQGNDDFILFTTSKQKSLVNWGWRKWLIYFNLLWLCEA
jgi:hypothetical protein